MRAVERPLLVELDGGFDVYVLFLGLVVGIAGVEKAFECLDARWDVECWEWCLMVSASMVLEVGIVDF